MCRCCIARLLRCLHPPAQRIPEWLDDEPFTFEDSHRPPSYLIASLQQAISDYTGEAEPPTYDHSVSSSSTRTRSPYRTSVAHESIWEDDSEDEEDEAGDDGEESGYAEHEADAEEDAVNEVGGEADAISLSQSTILQDEDEDMSFLSSPTSSSSSSSASTSSPSHLSMPPPAPPPKDFTAARPLPALPQIPPPAYELLHLQHVMRSEKLEKELYASLASCLGALDSTLLFAPFSVFADMCYEASVQGDTSPRTLRPYSISPHHISPPPLPAPVPSTSTAHAVEDDEESDEDEPMLSSPTQTYTHFASSPPIIWDARLEMEEHARSRSEIGFGMGMGMLRSMPTSFFSMSQDALASPTAKENHRPHTPHARLVRPLFIPLSISNTHTKKNSTGRAREDVRHRRALPARAHVPRRRTRDRGQFPDARGRQRFVETQSERRDRGYEGPAAAFVEYQPAEVDPCVTPPHAIPVPNSLSTLIPTPEYE
ncbi:hypothetical protein BDW22DRAFT_1171263 [Trametopsis cervina]|nr:hypothetical protein BDW22DRAFT_1171263 [Trametopsis cervina]